MGDLDLLIIGLRLMPHGVLPRDGEIWTDLLPGDLCRSVELSCGEREREMFSIRAFSCDKDLSIIG